MQLHREAVVTLNFRNLLVLFLEYVQTVIFKIGVFDNFVWVLFRLVPSRIFVTPAA